jgi:hypothetical protein
MTERKTLLESIAATTNDYRAGDLETPTPEHVDRWAKQFDASVQVPILREMDHVLKRTYFSKAGTRAFLGGLFKTEKLVGDDPCKFWKGVRFLDIQGGGNSQKEMLALFSRFLKKHCGFDVADCGEIPTAFAYLDDAIFTGNRVRRDLEVWIKTDAPANAALHVITIALHSGGQYYASSNIAKAANAAGKKIEVKWWRAIELEDRRSETSNSDVLRPVAIPNDPEVQGYVAAMKYQPVLRAAGNIGKNSLFSSDAGRQLLEQEFLKAGTKIRKLCPNLGDTQRPLGHMTLDTLGFGSLIVTFRNCPNNAPLALWAGDPWYPLFPRTTNSDTSLKRFMSMLAKDES